MKRSPPLVIKHHSVFTFHLIHILNTDEASFLATQIVNNKDADQPAHLRRLICAPCVHVQQSQVFSR